MIKNIISAFFTRGAVALINFAILLISSHALGGGIIGQLSLMILNIAIIQTVNEIYTGSASVYFMPKYSIRSIYRSGFFWSLLCILVLNSLFILLKIGATELSTHVFVLSFIITLNSFHSIILLSKEKIKTYNFLLFFQPALLLLVLVVNIFVLKNRTFSAYLFSLYVSFGTSLILSTWAIIKIINSDKCLTVVNIKSVFRNGFINQLGNLAHTLSNRFNYYLIGNSVLLGVYANATSLIESILIISGSVSPIVLTHVANQRDISNHSRVTFLLSKICFLLSLLCVLIIFLLPNNLFTYFLGPDFEQVKKIMLYLSPGILCISLVAVISHYFSGLGQQNVQLWANGLGLLVTICTSHFFISHYQLIGACYTATLSYLVSATVFLSVFMWKNNLRFWNLFELKNDFEWLKKETK